MIGLTIILPASGQAPAEPCPELLTETEAIRYLRLDRAGTKLPGKTLERYRRLGLLMGTRVGREIMFRRLELDRFIERQTESPDDRGERPDA